MTLEADNKLSPEIREQSQRYIDAALQGLVNAYTHACVGTSDKDKENKKFLDKVLQAESRESLTSQELLDWSNRLLMPIAASSLVFGVLNKDKWNENDLKRLDEFLPLAIASTSNSVADPLRKYATQINFAVQEAKRQIIQTQKQ